MNLHEAEIKIALLESTQKAMEEHIEANDRAIAALVDERNKALKWGITVLGASVIAMLKWIFDLLTKHPQ